MLEFRRAKSRVCVALVVTALAAVWLTPGTFGQNPQKKPVPKSEPQQQQGGMGGISSAGTFAPVYDAQKHPITAGGFVDKGTVVFEDATKAAGLSRWRHVMGTQKKRYILETDGSGVGLIDYDNDGWLDIYLVNGSTYEALSGKSTPPHAALFHNNHDGTFTDVAAKAHVTNDRWGFGVAIGDYDNDGWPDIFVCNFGANRLYRNNHDGTFIDVGEKVTYDDARPGDIVIFTSPTNSHRIGHVGIVYSNNGGEFKFIHSTSGKEHGVTITTMDDTYKMRFVQVVRLLKRNDVMLASQ